jgi:hypothetical protein
LGRTNNKCQLVLEHDATGVDQRAAQPLQRGLIRRLRLLRVRLGCRLLCRRRISLQQRSQGKG